jgi:hypothetical protein
MTAPLHSLDRRSVLKLAGLGAACSPPAAAQGDDATVLAAAELLD